MTSVNWNNKNHNNKTYLDIDLIIRIMAVVRTWTSVGGSRVWCVNQMLAEEVSILVGYTDIILGIQLTQQMKQKNDDPRINYPGSDWIAVLDQMSHSIFNFCWGGILGKI